MDLSLINIQKTKYSLTMLDRNRTKVLLTEKVYAANHQTQVQREGATEWLALAAVPEFAEALAAQAGAAAGAAAATPPPFSTGAVAGGGTPLAEGDYQLDVSGCLGRGWEMTKTNLGILLGGLLISDYTGRRLIEVDAKGKVVNEMRMGSRTVASLAVVEP